MLNWIVKVDVGYFLKQKLFEAKSESAQSAKEKKYRAIIFLMRLGPLIYIIASRTSFREKGALDKLAFWHPPGTLLNCAAAGCGESVLAERLQPVLPCPRCRNDYSVALEMK
ncbi:hypothetical protein Y1Q_0004326 [Alligator mississippiensis]|uniref:Uncharacterized protein n=1 Tax=Alligator mississippiensis TaxID=8496 RepID=A0A151MIG0_ALLMI|nr:hypothetical protein Y1Q_0004326 [Alligator mississippiensis]